MQLDFEGVIDSLREPQVQGGQHDTFCTRDLYFGVLISESP